MERRYEVTHRTVRRWSVADEIMAGIGMGIIFFLCVYALALT